MLGSSGCYLVHERPGSAGSLDGSRDRDAGAAADEQHADDGGGGTPVLCPGGPVGQLDCTQAQRDQCAASGMLVCAYGHIVDGGLDFECRSPAAARSTRCGGRCGPAEWCVGTECLPACCDADPSCSANGGTCAFMDESGRGICIRPTPCTLVPNDCPDGSTCALTEHGVTFCRSVAYPDDPLPALDSTGAITVGYCPVDPSWTAAVGCPVGAQCLRYEPAPLSIFGGVVCTGYCRPSHAIEDCGSPAFVCRIPTTPPTIDPQGDPVALPPGIGLCFPRH